MYTILVAGAGKSSIYLIRYLLTHAASNKCKIIVADGSAVAIAEKIGNHPHGKAAVIDIMDANQRGKLVSQANLVISLMPPHLHIHLAKDCLKYKKNLITSSYISPEMMEMDAEVKAAGLMFMCEMGLDPGIDHMTANQILHSVQRIAGQITSFKSYCGGLIAPESDTNPWHYKFTWNPINIITAGADGATYLMDNEHISTTYEQMFVHNKRIQVNGLTDLAFYPNRDSLHYLGLYNVQHAQTFLRATLRHPEFCKGWNALITLGLTDMKDTVEIENGTYADLLAQKTGYQRSRYSLRQHVAAQLNLDGDDNIMEMLDWLELFGNKPLPAKKSASSGTLLLDLLLEKWKMEPNDKDMVVMQHEVDYSHRSGDIKLVSTMVIKGEDQSHSAMSKTVGLPMGIFARMVMKKRLKLPTGVRIPNMPDVYKPVLKELKMHDIEFRDEVS